MSYREGSPEARAGRRGERVVDEWARRNGWWRLEVSNMGPAAMLVGPAGKLIALDRLYAMPTGTRWCDIKWKSGPTEYKARRCLVHGIDEPNWRHYLAVEEKTKIEADLAIVELWPDRKLKNKAPLDSHLLWASLKDLKGRIRQIANDMVYWNAADFNILGPIDVGTEELPPTQLNLNPWEKPDRHGKFKIAPRQPDQMDLFNECWGENW